MHGEDVVLLGPVWLFATALMVLVLFLAFFVIADVWRRVRTGRGGPPREPLWLYAAIQGGYLATFVVVQFLGGVALVSAIPVALAPLALIVGITYLLRVVYPKPRSEES